MHMVRLGEWDVCLERITAARVTEDADGFRGYQVRLEDGTHLDFEDLDGALAAACDRYFAAMQEGKLDALLAGETVELAAEQAQRRYAEQIAALRAALDAALAELRAPRPEPPALPQPIVFPAPVPAPILSQVRSRASVMHNDDLGRAASIDTTLEYEPELALPGETPAPRLPRVKHIHTDIIRDGTGAVIADQATYEYEQ